jgi:hypothetical protein
MALSFSSEQASEQTKINHLRLRHAEGTFLHIQNNGHDPCQKLEAAD